MPNIYGGNQNLGAVAFLQDLNHLLGRHHPGVLTIAEESTAWPGVTQAVSEGGLGFDYKWNMGWMNDTLHYFKTPAQQRPNEQQAITFPLTYAFDEQFILPFSHDEVVHLKKSLWSKMPGLNAQKYDQLKLLLLYMMGYPGKKLLFMGAEWAEKKEWAESQSLDWSLVEEPTHKEIQQFLERLLRMYKSEPALHRSDTTESGFIWNDLAKNNSAVFSFSRQQAANEPRLLFVFNFLNKKITNYEIRNFEHKEAELIINTRSSTPVGQVSSPVSLAPFQGIVLKETANN
jgi:1,4-alpha-glucan branching enzyme